MHNKSGELLLDANNNLGDNSLTNSLAEIDERVEVYRNALNTLPEGSNEYMDILEMLGGLHQHRSKLISKPNQDHDEAIDIYREFCRLCPNSERRLSALHKFAGLLQERATNSRAQGFNRAVYRSARDDHEEALAIEREALSICEPKNLLHGHVLGRIGVLLLSTRNLDETREGIQLLQSATHAWPAGNPNRLEYLNELADGLRRLIITSESSVTQTETETLAGLYAEIAEYHSENTTEYVEWLIKSGSILCDLCKPPFHDIEKISELSKLAFKILQHSPDNSDAKEYMTIAHVAQQWMTGSSNHNIPAVDEPDHKSIMKKFRLDNIEITDTLIKPIYKDVYFGSTEEIESELAKNLWFLSEEVNDKHRIGIACLNAAEMLRKLGASQRVAYIEAAVHYQLWANQLIPADHEFRSRLHMHLVDDYGSLYICTNDLDYFKKSIQLQYLSPGMPKLIGPYQLTNPWTDNAEAYEQKLRPALENSYTLIAHARDKLVEENSTTSKSNLIDRLFYHERRFYTRNDTHFNDMINLHGELLNDPSTKKILDLSAILLLRYHQTGNLEYLRSAMNTNHQTTVTRVRVLHEMFIREGNLGHINEGIALARSGRLNRLLGKLLNTRYFVRGDYNDLEAALEQTAETVDKAQAYLFKYEKFAHSEDLDQVFQYGYFDDDEGRVASHYEDYDYYENIQRTILHCHALAAKSTQQNDVELLEKAINILAGNKLFCPPPLQPMFNHCYASLILQCSNSQEEEVRHAFNMCEEGLRSLRSNCIFWSSINHVIGRLLHRLYTITNNFEFLTSSIQALKKSTSTLQPCSPSYGKANFDLGASLKSFITQSVSTLDDAISAFQSVCDSPASSFEIQYKSAIEWAKLADEKGPKEALQAYEYAINVLPHLASLSLDVKNRHRRLIELSIQGISSEAAACAIKVGDIKKAVEFLEHGRSVFWQQAMNLHSSAEILQDQVPDLAKELLTLSRELNISGFHTQFSEASKNYQNFLNRESTKRINLAEKWNKTLEKARSIPGCEDLLKPVSYTQLARATSKSIIVMLSLTTQRTHAIIMEAPSSPPASLELPYVSRDYVERMVITLQEILKGNNLRESREAEYLERAGRPLVSFAVANGDRKMYLILSDLWAKIVKPVLDFIQLKPTRNAPHITWCCADILAMLPIHAAGVYQGPNPENLFEYAISSYTSSLSNLRSSASSIRCEKIKILLAGMEKAPGYPILPNVIQEIHYVQNAIDAAKTKTILIDSEATGIKLLENMANAHLVHLACHGIASSNPMDSAIILHDGPLKIDRLIRIPFKNAQLAFLSACQTAKVNPFEADESIHIASAMITAGFKSVVATLWSINDSDAPIVAKKFYEELVVDGYVNVQDAAAALHTAINELRMKGVSPLRWVPFIHMGV